MDGQGGAVMLERSRQWAWVVGVVAAALAVVVGMRVDTDVFVFILGVVCGWLSGVPLAVGVTVLVLRQRDEREWRRERWRREQQPPVVVVTAGGQAPQLYSQPRTGYVSDLPPVSAGRAFDIIGEE